MSTIRMENGDLEVHTLHGVIFIHTFAKFGTQVSVYEKDREDRPATIVNLGGPNDA